MVMGRNLIVEAVKERYLQGEPAHELAWQIIKMTEGIYRAGAGVDADWCMHDDDLLSLWWNDLFDAAQSAIDLFDNDTHYGDITVQKRDIPAVRSELIDVAVVLACAWELCRQIDGDETLLDVAALAKARGDVERGMRGDGNE